MSEISTLPAGSFNAALKDGSAARQVIAGRGCLDRMWSPRDPAPKIQKRETCRPFPPLQTLKTIGAVFRMLAGLKILRSELLGIFPGNVAGFSDERECR